MGNTAKLRDAQVSGSSPNPLHDVILEHQAALEELESSNRELESVLDHLLPFRRNPGAARQEASNARQSPGAGMRIGLSKRELQVLALMVDGKTSKEIAAQLGISFKTTATHRSSILGKLDVHETASVVREAIRRGLV